MSTSTSVVFFTGQGAAFQIATAAPRGFASLAVVLQTGAGTRTGTYFIKIFWLSFTPVSGLEKHS